MNKRFNIGDKVIVIKGSDKGIISDINDVVISYSVFYKLYGNEEDVWVNHHDVVSYKEYNRNKLLEELLGGI